MCSIRSGSESQSVPFGEVAERVPVEAVAKPRGAVVEPLEAPVQLSTAAMLKSFVTGREGGAR